MSGYTATHLLQIWQNLCILITLPSDLKHTWCMRSFSGVQSNSAHQTSMAKVGLCWPSRGTKGQFQPLFFCFLSLACLWSSLQSIIESHLCWKRPLRSLGPAIKHLLYLALLQAEGSLTHASVGSSQWGEPQLYHEGLILGTQGQEVLLSCSSPPFPWWFSTHWRYLPHRLLSKALNLFCTTPCYCCPCSLDLCRAYRYKVCSSLLLYVSSFILLLLLQGAGPSPIQPLGGVWHSECYSCALSLRACVGLSRGSSSVTACIPPALMWTCMMLSAASSLDLGQLITSCRLLSDQSWCRSCPFLGCIIWGR